MSKRGHERTFWTEGTSIVTGSVHVGLVISPIVQRRWVHFTVYTHRRLKMCKTVITRVGQGVGSGKEEINVAQC